MREVAVITRSDGENSEPIEAKANRQSLPGDPSPNCADASEVHQGKRNSGRVDDIVTLGAINIRRGHRKHSFVSCFPAVKSLTT